MANEFKAFDVYVYDSQLHNDTPDHSGHYLYVHFHSRTTVTHIIYSRDWGRAKDNFPAF